MKYRKRIIFKHERQKQKEFFEKKKLSSKLKLLESSSSKNPATSLDLLNLYIVNQISSKKEMDKKPQHVNMSKTALVHGNDNATLPMSPITIPSKLCLDDSEIVSSQVKTAEGTMKSDTSNYPSKQELNSEENVDVSADDKSRREFHMNFSKRQPETKPISGIQHFHSNSINTKNLVI
ncbi:regulator of DNA class I crossover intermediates 1 isoform X2 [Hyperolius riggenbachi]|uniref:regulator of DNA class I crossover intermediates 1 isoform X2 n=1 Tax=Hyperolius riggenbachi TaxID=752182 RepID=UPI0035A32110